VDKKERFIAAVKDNEGLVYKVAAVYTNTAEDRNDLVQEIIYQLWKSFDSFGQKAALSTWMYRVAMNVAVYHLKTSRRKILTVPLDGEAANIQEGDTDLFEEQLQVLRLHTGNLSLLEKGIVMLYLENKSYQEIAQIVGISETNVGTKIGRIKEKLKKQITKNL
jgi:RNA polymerase sigma factor (sigma-70 family)